MNPVSSSSSSSSVPPRPPPQYKFTLTSSGANVPSPVVTAAGGGVSWIKSLYQRPTDTPVLGTTPAAPPAASAPGPDPAPLPLSSTPAPDPLDGFVPRAEKLVVLQRKPSLGVSDEVAKKTTTTKKKKEEEEKAKARVTKKRRVVSVDASEEEDEETPEQEREEEKRVLAKLYAEKADDSDSFVVYSDDVVDGEADEDDEARARRRKLNKARYVMTKEISDESDTDPYERAAKLRRQNKAKGFIDNEAVADEEEKEDDGCQGVDDGESDDDDFELSGHEPDGEESSDSDNDDVDNDADDDDNDEEEEEEGAPAPVQQQAMAEEEDDGEDRMDVDAPVAALADYLIREPGWTPTPPPLPAQTPAPVPAAKLSLKVPRTLSDAAGRKSVDAASSVAAEERRLVADANRAVHEMVGAAIERAAQHSRPLEQLGLFRKRNTSAARGDYEHLRQLRLNILRIGPCAAAYLARLAHQTAAAINAAAAAAPTADFDD